VTLVFFNSTQSKSLVCSGDEQEKLLSQSEFFLTLLGGLDQKVIEIPEDEPSIAVALVLDLVARDPVFPNLKWNTRWARICVKWQLTDRVSGFAEKAHNHFVKLLQEQKERFNDAQSIFFLAPDEVTGANNIFDPTDEVNSHGEIIYQMRDDPNSVIEYWAPLKHWQWKYRSMIGTSMAHVKETRPLQPASQPALQAITEVKFATPKGVWDDKSVKVTVIPLGLPKVQPLPPSKDDIDLFWFMCEAIIQFPALAKEDGLIRTKEDVMNVLAKHEELWDKTILKRIFSQDDILELAMRTASAASVLKKRSK